MRAYYVRGMALAQTGARGRAYEDLERTAGGAQDPVLAGNAYAVLGVLHFEDGHWIQAQRAFRAAIDRLPPRPPCDALLYRRGLCQERSGRWSEALMSYEHVVHDYPAGPYAGNAQRRLQLQADHFAVQCGVFAEQANADRLVADLAERGLSTYVRGENRGGQQCFIVLHGRFTSYEDAIDALAQAKGYVPGAVLWP
jgi:tetratricopeptide (TPR) repeat protein